MSRTTLADAKASRCPEVLNVGPNDSRFANYLNEATQRLLTKGKWWGTIARFRFCAQDSCLTLPRQIAAIEAVAICGQPIPVYDQFYEFLENGFGLRGGDGACGLEEAIYRGHFPAFDDVRGANKKLRVMCDLASDIGLTVLLLGYDENNNWIRTSQDGVIKDGELVALAQSPGTVSSKTFSVLTDVQLPQRESQTWLYEYDGINVVNRLIARYDYDELRPSYARWFFPSIRASSDCSTTTLVEVLAKLEFIPVKNDSDYLLIGNLPALKLMCSAVKKYEEDNFKDGAALEAMAIRELDSELDHHLGSGRKIGINIVGSSIGTSEPIPSLL